MIAWIALALSLVGNLLINYKNILGIYVWIISNILWIIVAVNDVDQQKIILFSTYIAFNIHGLIKWSKKS